MYLQPLPSTTKKEFPDIQATCPETKILVPYSTASVKKIEKMRERLIQQTVDREKGTGKRFQNDLFLFSVPSLLLAIFNKPHKNRKSIIL